MRDTTPLLIVGMSTPGGWGFYTEHEEGVFFLFFFVGFSANPFPPPAA